MAKQRFGLGRGLDALISGASEIMPTQQAGTPANEAVPLVALESIIPNPRQPRRSLREDDPRLLELSASIKEHGLIQPIIVTRLTPQEQEKLRAPLPPPSSPSSDEQDGWFGDNASAPPKNTTATPEVLYQIIAGERRWRAARQAGLTQVPIVIKHVTPQQMLEMALIENIQRADLNPIEEASAYQALIQEFGLTQEMVARQVGKDRTTITNSLRLLQLAAKVRETLMNQYDHFTEGHARALVGIREEDQVQAMNQIIALRLNVRQAEELATRLKGAEHIDKAVESVTKPEQSPEINNLETHFRNALMVKVDLKYNPKGKGTLVLHFNNQGELESLYDRLVKRAEDA